ATSLNATTTSASAALPLLAPCKPAAAAGPSAATSTTRTPCTGPPFAAAPRKPSHRAAGGGARGTLLKQALIALTCTPYTTGSRGGALPAKQARASSATTSLFWFKTGLPTSVSRNVFLNSKAPGSSVPPPPSNVEVLSKATCAVARPCSPREVYANK